MANRLYKEAYDRLYKDTLLSLVKMLTHAYHVEIQEQPPGCVVFVVRIWWVFKVLRLFVTDTPLFLRVYEEIKHLIPAGVIVDIDARYTWRRKLSTFEEAKRLLKQMD